MPCHKKVKTTFTNEGDYNAQLQKLVQYIEQDGHEKAEEIDVLAEEEYFIEKSQYINTRIEAVKKFYDNLEKKYKIQVELDKTKIKNQAYRDILSARNSVVDDVLKTTKLRLANLTEEQNICLYKKVLYQLTIQGLVKMMEPDVKIEVRKKDVEVAKKVVKQAQEYFSQKTGMAVSVAVSESRFLPEKSSGGLVIHNTSDRVGLNNTLETKLELVGSTLMPHIRKALFGVNLNRVHSD